MDDGIGMGAWPASPAGTVGHLRDQHGASLTEIVGPLNRLIDRDGPQE